jgi:trimeric autotransporter adhesin
MKRNGNGNRKAIALWGTLLFGATAGASSVQAQDIPFHDEVFELDSRSAGPVPFNAPRAADGRAIVLSEEVRLDDAAWLQLSFAEASLGATGTLRITSLEDGDTQEMGARELAAWGNATAYFNGDAVQLSLLAAPDEAGVFFRMESVRVGEIPEELIGTAAVCGMRDDRQFSSDRRVARLSPVGCTAWLIPNGALLSAGHCVADPRRVTIAEFNTPQSRSDRTIVRSAVRDQYPVVRESIRGRNEGLGQDWGVFAVGPNASTGMTALAAQGGAFEISRSNAPGTVRITGYGTAMAERNQSQQTSEGTYEGERVGEGTRVSHRYRVDTTGGNSGSPIIASDGVSAIGIHTNGGCSAQGGRNIGTSFNNTELLGAIQAVGEMIAPATR